MTDGTDHRIEYDTLGKVAVPSDALFGAQTQRAIDNFQVSGLRPWPAFIWSMAAIKQAAAEVNLSLGLLPSDLATAITSAATEVIEGEHNDQFRVDPFQAGAGTSHNMNVNEVIANRATQLLGGELGEYRVHPNDHVNMAQSTNDTIPTAIRIGCLWRLDELMHELESLVQALQMKGNEFDRIVKSGRTHLQDAVPVRLGQEFRAYAKAVERDSTRIRTAAGGLTRIGIGGTAAGTGLNAHPEFHVRIVVQLSEITGLPLESSDDLFESMQSMADAADFSAALRTLALTLTRIANDLRLMASGPGSGLNEVRLPAVQPGSSIMPGKVNPVMAEMVNMAMFHIIGCDTTVAYAAQAGQLELNVMMPVIAHNLFEMMQVMIGALRSFTDRCVRGIEANPEMTEFWLERNAIIITALNPIIGYKAGAEIVQTAIAEGRSVREVAEQMAGDGDLRHQAEDRTILPDEVRAALDDLYGLTEGGIVDRPG